MQTHELIWTIAVSAAVVVGITVAVIWGWRKRTNAKTVWTAFATAKGGQALPAKWSITAPRPLTVSVVVQGVGMTAKARWSSGGGSNLRSPEHTVIEARLGGLPPHFHLHVGPRREVRMWRDIAFPTGDGSFDQYYLAASNEPEVARARLGARFRLLFSRLAARRSHVVLTCLSEEHTAKVYYDGAPKAGIAYVKLWWRPVELEPEMLDLAMQVMVAFCCGR